MFPAELIVQIASHLPPNSVISLSLCSRYYYSAFEPENIKDLGSYKTNRYRFLFLLERDLPGHILCYYCTKLHAINKAHRHLKSNRRGLNDWLACWMAHSYLETGDYVHSNFSPAIFQMTMKLYRLGQGYAELLKLLCLEPTTCYRNSYVEQRTALVKIVAGSLFIREQRVYNLHASAARVYSHIPSGPHCICPHLRFLPGLRDKNVRVYREHISGGRLENHGTDLFQCKYCRTEFQVNFKPFGICGNAMYVTKWQDLGDGRSALEQKWQSHITSLNRPYSFFEKGSICAAFERKDHSQFEFDSILSPSDEEVC